MDRLAELLEITLKIISVKTMDVIYPVYKLGEYLGGFFAFRFAAVLLGLFIVLRIMEKAAEYYALHNFIHKKMVTPSAGSAEYKLFLSHVWEYETSKGIVANHKTARSRLLRFNKEELNSIQAYLKTRRRTVNRSLLYILSASFTAGVLSAYVSEWAYSNGLDREFFLKTALFTAVWYLIFELRQRNKLHQIIQMTHSVSETISLLEEDHHIPSYEGDHEVYSSRGGHILDT
ncbi:hypothetical protein ACFFJY_05725 [Fictibacillus aquaticus]|uniref:Uncharacterized protein n=1 Tax=Fictibacillus aquaticus TaxID=2021314 RepID=A0A235FBH9_9BACL|nr:hypothetical protein [Fictibacillus aquaticus]OYD58297.1 hypothetical protein CGZ90_10485 [Fictibacillus aquaticus]